MQSKRSNLQGRLLLLMQSKKYSPSNQDQIARQLKLSGKDSQHLKRTLKSMRHKGLAERTKGGRWSVSSSDRLIRGRLSVHPSGFGICTPENQSEEDEFFIPPRYINGAIDDDTVMIQMRPTLRRLKKKTASGRDMRKIAEVILVEKHGKESLPGLFVKSKGGFAVQPDSGAIEHDVIVDGVEIPDMKHADLIDHKVVVKLSPPKPKLGAKIRISGVVIEDLGHRDAPGVDVLSIAKQHEIDGRFSAELESETSRMSKSVSDRDIASREDHRNLLTVTIDPENARDFDDAVSIERDQNGNWTLFVHIADVAHYVGAGEAIDIEARRRGNSTYLVDRVLPMLPEHLTNDVCSLRPNVDSLTHSAKIRFNPKGEVLESSTCRSVIHSDARLIYEQVQAFFDGRSDHGIKKNITPALADMRKLALVLRRKRVAEGSLDFSMPDVRCILDKTGKCVDIVQQGGLEACRVVEEFMLAANRIVAKMLSDSGRDAVYRVHDEPDEQEWRDLLAELRVLGVDPLPHKFSDINDAMAKMADSGGAHAFNIRILRTMKKAIYSTESTGHFGLGFDYYTHFTSPIRRYPDLIVHRLLSAIENGDESYKPSKSELKDIARHCTETEIESQQAERESVDLKRIAYFKDRLGRGETGPYRGVVVTILSKGLLVELDDTLQSGLVPFAELKNDHFTVSEDGLVARGRRTGKIWKVGQTLDVHVSKVDENRRQVDFRL